MSAADIAVPLGAAAIAAIAALGGSWSGSRNDKAKWLREQRREAYTALLDAIQELMARCDPILNARVDESGVLSTFPIKARAASNLVEVLGPDNVAQFGNEYYDAMIEFLDHLDDYSVEQHHQTKAEKLSKAKSQADDVIRRERQFASAARRTLG